MEREEKQAWENIERFQKRVAAQHKLQQQILMKLIREVNELEEKDKLEEEMLHQFTRDVTAEFKEAFRKLDERKRTQGSQAQTKEQ